MKYHHLNKSVLLTLYAPLFHSNLDFCITVWGHAANKYNNLLQKLQNRVVTHNFNREYQVVSSSGICQDLGWMSLHKHNVFKSLVGCFMHKIINIFDLGPFNFVLPIDNLEYQIFYSLNHYNDFSLILICFFHFNYFVSRPTLGSKEEQIPVCFYHIVYLNCVLKP